MSSGVKGPVRQGLGNGVDGKLAVQDRDASSHPPTASQSGADHREAGWQCANTLRFKATSMEWWDGFFDCLCAKESGITMQVRMRVAKNLIRSVEKECENLAWEESEELARLVLRRFERFEREVLRDIDDANAEYTVLVAPY